MLLLSIGMGKYLDFLLAGDKLLDLLLKDKSKNSKITLDNIFKSKICDTEQYTTPNLFYYPNAYG